MRSIKRPFTLGRHAPDRTPEPAATSIHDMRRYHTIIFHAAASILAPQPVRQIWLELVGTPRERASATAERRTQRSEESSHRKRRMALNAHGRCAKKKGRETRTLFSMPRSPSSWNPMYVFIAPKHRNAQPRKRRGRESDMQPCSADATSVEERTRGTDRALGMCCQCTPPLTPLFHRGNKPMVGERGHRG